MDSFMAAEQPPNEPERQAAVDRSGLLVRRPDRLQQIVREVTATFDVPIAAVSIIDRDRQWFAARIGLEPEETSRAISFCAHTILRPGEAMVVPDATRDPRFAGNPLVKAAPHIRFYAGMPLVDRGGYPLGTLCMIDTKARRDPTDLYRLGHLAREVEGLIAR